MTLVTNYFCITDKKFVLGRTGFLTKEEFMVLADLILRNYELKPDEVNFYNFIA
jgi:hypothetical protein